jgi:UDP-GlcNAc3NAcA epimerase
MKIVTVVGARPQFIKASAFTRVAAAGQGISEILVNTGQHYDDSMSDIFFRELEIGVPAYNLGIRGKRHGEMTGRQLEAVESVLIAEKPDVVLVYGDTNSTLAGALAAVKLHIPVAHVEAGLRSFNRAMPEEINRVLTDHISTVLYPPTAAGERQLAQEGVAADKIVQVGDIMFDVALYFGARAIKESDIVSRLGLRPGGYAISTVHRAENTDDPVRLAAVLEGLREVARSMPVVLPLHPRTRGVLSAAGELDQVARDIILVEPLGYLDMTALVASARLVLTDSGGLQKEAYFHRVPAVTLRTETEWRELVDIGANRLPARLDRDGIGEAVSAALASTVDHAHSPYGDGQAAAKIADDLLSRFG